MNYTIMAADHGTRIDITGDFTANFPEALGNILDAVILASTRVEISLFGISQMDAAGAQLLVEAKEHGLKSGIPVTLRGIGAKMKKVFLAAYS